MSRADVAAAFTAGPAAAAVRAGAGAPRPAEAFLDLPALLREARAAGGDALIFSADGDEDSEDGIML